MGIPKTVLSTRMTGSARETEGRIRALFRRYRRPSVLLVAAAVVAGLAHFEPGLHLAGVILGQTASSRHEDILRRAIETYTDIPVLGCLPRQRRNPLPERHMGLATLGGDAFSQETENLLDELARLVREHVDVDNVLTAARSAPVLEIPLPPACGNAAEALYGSPDTKEQPPQEDGIFAVSDALDALEKENGESYSQFFVYVDMAFENEEEILGKMEQELGAESAQKLFETEYTTAYLVE